MQPAEPSGLSLSSLITGGRETRRNLAKGYLKFNHLDGRSVPIVAIVVIANETRQVCNY